MSDFRQDTRDVAQFPKEEEECRTDRLLPCQMDLVRRLFDRFLEGLSSTLSSYLLTAVAVRFSGATEQLLDLALRDLEEGGCIISLAAKGLPHCVRLVFARGFACEVLESLLGAPAEAARSRRKLLTRLDLQILREFNEAVTKELNKAWQNSFAQPINVLSTELVAGFDTSPIEDQNSAVLTADIVIGGRTESIKLIVPSVLLRLLAELPTERPADVLGQWLDALSMEVEGVLHGADIQARELLALKPGKILKLPQKAHEPIHCRINGVTKFRGELVTSDNSLGLQIHSQAPEPPNA